MHQREKLYKGKEGDERDWANKPCLLPPLTGEKNKIKH